MRKCVQEQDIVVLIDENGKKNIINTKGKTDKVKGIGVIDPKGLVGQVYGSEITIGNKQFLLFSPSLLDKLHSIKRKAQIILPQDIGHIIINCGIESGKTVLEAGIGSGSLTIALATMVAPTGKVISYDTRQEFIDHAMNNITHAGLKEYVVPKNNDVTKSIEDSNLDAIILDIPDPWDAIAHVWSSLTIGGYCCCYSPLSTQVEQTRKALLAYPFCEIKTLENIQREIVVSSHGMRPSFNGLGHTGYLTFARKKEEKRD